MSQLFSLPPDAPPIAPAPAVPTLTDEMVQKRAADEARSRQQGGRASQFMTNPMTQLDAGPSHKRTLGAA